MSIEEFVKLETLGNGAISERFDDELVKVLENIGDVNTDPAATREVVLVVKIKPDLERETASVVIESRAKLAPTRGVSTVFYMGKHPDGRLRAVEYDPKQGKLAFDTSKLERIDGGSK